MRRLEQGRQAQVIIEQGQQPHPEPVNRGRREFLKVALMGGITVFSGVDFINTGQKLAQVRKDADEELKQQGKHPATEEEIRTVQQEDYGYGIVKNLKDPRDIEALKTIRKAGATYKKLREYSWAKRDLVWEKASHLYVRGFGDFVGVIGGAVMTTNILINGLKSRDKSIEQNGYDRGLEDSTNTEMLPPDKFPSGPDIDSMTPKEFDDAIAQLEKGLGISDDKENSPSEPPTR